MRADVVTTRRGVVGELRDSFQDRVVLIDLPRGLIDLLGALDQGEPQREQQFLAVRRHIEIPYVAQAGGDRFGEIHFYAAGARLVADVQVPAGGGCNEVSHIDVCRRRRTLDVGQRIGERAGILRLRSGESGSVTADAAAASDQREQRKDQREQGRQERCPLRQSVTMITRSHVVVHWFNAPVRWRVPHCSGVRTGETSRTRSR